MLYGLIAGVMIALVFTGGVFVHLSARIRVLQDKLQQAECNTEQQIKIVMRRLDNYLTGSIQMGEELHNLRQEVAPIPEKLMQMEQRDPSMLSFIEAARLVSLGANVEDLQQACGLSHAEAELLKRVHDKKPSQ